jgi:hypothetical protein
LPRRRCGLIRVGCSVRFGAVVEEFEVHDALTVVFAEKDHVPVFGGAAASSRQIVAH